MAALCVTSVSETPVELERMHIYLFVHVVALRVDYF
jgi:hypothetical protein